MLYASFISNKNKIKLKSIGIYQMLGGGFGLLFLLIFGASAFLSTYIISGILFSFSIYSGYSCFKLRKNRFTLTYINQILQSLAFTIGSITFEYVSGVGLNFTLDMTDSFKIGYEFNILSTVSAGFYEDGTEKYYIGFNLIAMYIIYLTEKIQKSIKSDI